MMAFLYANILFKPSRLFRIKSGRCRGGGQLALDWVLK
jgi:hypothetical protein